MTRPRSQLVCIEETPYYHITSRCVRRSFLCGIDQVSGQDYEHRRAWVEERIHVLSSLFAIDICSYVVMSNHYHIVLRLSPEEANHWCDTDVCKRWLSLFRGPSIMQMYQTGQTLNDLQLASVNATIAIWKQRLTSLSWFMKCLNEPIARMANQEDGCTGHFWESRYKSQCLKTEQALLSCMAYTELNPIRANMAETPETSEHTSIKERIHPSINLSAAIKQQISNGQLHYFDMQPKTLMPFSNGTSSHIIKVIPCAWHEYLTLVDWTGRIIKEGKRGYIAAKTPTILDRLNIKKTQWLAQATSFEKLHSKLFNREIPTLKANSS